MVVTHHRARRGVMTRRFWRLRWGGVALTAAWQQLKRQRGGGG
ncbi:hypothetical protein F3Y22_tig00110882pilonHSYRG00129 [Hibiscus syriacus]|uniref:Uncharacterized protein n=1 Tax=Hibiscus syriacus TaxID=106335 RepID=A0A6A2ZJB5_HIBSY|nr:hypothetical protein F3Y22_tig00110882pilonHSYRG00129 [Hibiscus syriacus]